MRIRRMMRVGTVACLVVVVLTYILSHFTAIKRTLLMVPSFTNRPDAMYSRYLVDTDACRIPDFDPFDPALINIIEKGEPLQCGHIIGLTYQIGNVVYVNKTVESLLYAKPFLHCDSDTIERVFGNSDDGHKFTANKDKFKDKYELKAQFTRVRCYDTSRKEIHSNYYIIYVPKPEPESRYKKSFHRHMNSNSVKRAHNVLMIAIDSTSRLNFMRHLQETRRYIMDELGAVDITGYNKVADNTFVNLVPVLMGKYVPELPYNDTTDRKTRPFDEYDSMFKRFNAAGYRTLFTEDTPNWAIFNYLRAGFFKEPTDYYGRPFSLAMERDKTIWGGLNNHCVHERSEEDIYLDYVYRFMEGNTIAKRPYFAFCMLGRITHDYMNRAALCDGHHYKFLQRLQANGMLNNTVMFYFSDHGMRYGKIRTSYIGSITARLPAMYVYLPPSFKRDHPALYRNVVTNAHRLTTPFDIHETLRDLLYFNERVGRPGNVRSRRISLLSEIPTSRTCDHASIDAHWCTCAEETSIGLNSTLIFESAKFLVEHLNKITEVNGTVCSKLALDNISKASIKVFSHSITTTPRVENHQDPNAPRAPPVLYQLTIATSPGGGMFEGTVQISWPGNKMEVVGDVSRVNAYGDSSWCVTLPLLRKICHCKK